MNDVVNFNAVMECFEQKGILTDLEKDIFSTIQEYLRNPFNRKGAEKK